MPTVITTIYFDLGETLGRPIFSPANELVRIEPFDFAPGLLVELHDRGLRLGLISNTGDVPGTRMNELLQEAGLYEPLDPALLIYSKDLGGERIKNTPAVFIHAATLVGLEETPGQCLFVGEDAGERSCAEEARWQVCADPRDVTTLLDS